MVAQVKFLDVDESEGKMVVSQKRASNELKPELRRGEVVDATVTGLRPYGVFLEVQGESWPQPLLSPVICLSFLCFAPC